MIEAGVVPETPAVREKRLEKKPSTDARKSMICFVVCSFGTWGYNDCGERGQERSPIFEIVYIFEFIYLAKVGDCEDATQTDNGGNRNLNMGKH